MAVRPRKVCSKIPFSKPLFELYTILVVIFLISWQTRFSVWLGGAETRRIVVDKIKQSSVSQRERERESGTQEYENMTCNILVCRRRSRRRGGEMSTAWSRPRFVIPVCAKLMDVEGRPLRLFGRLKVQNIVWLVSLWQSGAHRLSSLPNNSVTHELRH